MRVHLAKWGNSLGLRVPREVARRLDLSEGSEVDLETDASGRVILTPARPRYTLEELLAQGKSKGKRDPADEDWTSGGPAGRELL